MGKDTVVKIAVTGGSGFLGRAAVQAAQDAGHEAWSVDLASGFDVMSPPMLAEGLADADTVIHLAGVLGTSELFDAPAYAVDVNIKGTLNVLDWCRTNKAGYVGITMPPVFPSVYTATKVCAQRLASAWHTAYDVPVAHVRAFNAYGPGQAHGPGHPQKILPTFARAGWDNRPIPVWGDGEQTVDLVHADDVGRMLVDACAHGDDAVFDAGTGRSVSVNSLASFVIGYTGSTAGIEHLPMRAGETATRIVAEGEGWERLTWKPELVWDQVGIAVESYRSA